MSAINRPAVLSLLLMVCGCQPPTTADGGVDAGLDGGADAGTDRPRKFVFVFDGSQSLSVTDPNGTRGEALRQLLESLPSDPQISISVLVFAGSTTAFLTTPAFVPLMSLSPADRATLIQRVITFSNPVGGATDFVRPLGDVFMTTSTDISQAQAAMLPVARYAMVFVSDGAPSINQDAELLCGNAVSRFRTLLPVDGDVRVSTVHVFTPVQSVPTTCTADAGVTAPAQPCGVPLVTNPSVCPIASVNESADRLRRMAELGGGAFRAFRNQEPVSFTGLFP